MKSIVFVVIVLIGIAIAARSGRTEVASAPPAETQLETIADEAATEIADESPGIALSKQSVKACRDRCAAACVRCMKANGKGCSAKKSSCYMGCN